MIAIITGTGRNPRLHGLDEHLPLTLFPLVDRPLLQHIVEYLVSLGVRRFEFILNHLPETVESFMGDGARWGCTFGFHLFPTGESPFKQVQTIVVGFEEEILLGRVDQLPELTMGEPLRPAVYYRPDGEWTGWAVLPPCTPGLFMLDRLPGRDLFLGAFERRVVTVCVSFEAPGELLDSQSGILRGQFPALMIGGRQNEPGIWISRNVSLHPTARVQAPAYIGANCRIGRGARIGPCAVIGENCIVGDQSTVADSSIAPGTYIGEGLELDRVIVDRNRLVNVRIGTSLLVSETFLLGSLTEKAAQSSTRQLISRLAALLLMLLTLPFVSVGLLYFLLVRGAKFVQCLPVRIPADDNPAGWRDYLLPRLETAGSLSRWGAFVTEIWPGLFSVLRGHLSLVGVLPRSRAEIERLPGDWKSIYLKSKAGLITEASVMFGRSPCEDDLYTAEAYYSATKTLLGDAKLLALYFWGMLVRPRGPDLAEEPRP